MCQTLWSTGYKIPLSGLRGVWLSPQLTQIFFLWNPRFDIFFMLWFSYASIVTNLNKRKSNVDFISSCIFQASTWTTDKNCARRCNKRKKEGKNKSCIPNEKKNMRIVIDSEKTATSELKVHFSVELWTEEREKNICKKNALHMLYIFMFIVQSSLFRLKTVLKSLYFFFSIIIILLPLKIP